MSAPQDEAGTDPDQAPGGGPGWRVRFAPSPTGALHLGSLRTALFNWLAARSTGGSFVLRIEDTDQGRYVPGSEQQIIESLRWLGLDWDEGPLVGGPHSPYVQTLRLQFYRQYALELATTGAAYWCTCSEERLETMRADQRRRGEPTRYDRRCLHRQEDVLQEVEAGERAVLRQRIPEGTTTWTDLIRGEISFDNAEVDDQVLLKGDDHPTYHLANVVDDHLMAITHVLRAEEWIPSTPKHIALYRAFGWEPPRFAHVPMVLGEDGQKLSKRRGAADVLALRDRGYLPAAVVNAMALLGWSSGTEEEVFTPAELCDRFSIDRVNASPAVFDPRRLDALNGLHIRRLDDAGLAAVLEPWLPGVDEDTRLQVAPLLRERLPRLDAAAPLVAPLLAEPVWGADVEWPAAGLGSADAAAILDAAASAVEQGLLDDPDAFIGAVKDTLGRLGLKTKQGFPVLYTAVLGSPRGLPVVDVMRFIGEAASLARIRAARARLSL